MHGDTHENRSYVYTRIERAYFVKLNWDRSIVIHENRSCIYTTKILELVEDVRMPVLAIFYQKTLEQVENVSSALPQGLSQLQSSGCGRQQPLLLCSFSFCMV